MTPRTTITALALAAALPAFAAWPEKPVRIVVTFAAGGASDIVARVIGEQISKKLGQPVIVDNRPGAGGSVGGSAVAQSAPDGYTLMLTSNGHIISKLFNESVSYDPITLKLLSSTRTAQISQMYGC